MKRLFSKRRNRKNKDFAHSVLEQYLTMNEKQREDYLMLISCMDGITPGRFHKLAEWVRWEAGNQ